MLKLFEKCPSCGGPLTITEIQCARCNLVMQAEFVPGPFSALSDDQITFVRAFLKVRGNLSELEKLLGISYPTIRNKLDEINTSLERAETPEPSAAALETPGGERQAILQQVSAGKISAVEAIQLLNQMKGN